MVSPLYRGFSTKTRTGIDTRVFDIELVKADLKNKFDTRLGERVGRPDEGSIIHDLLFEPIDSRTEALVTADAQRIINEDPRVELIDMVVDFTPEANTIQINMTYYLRINLKCIIFNHGIGKELFAHLDDMRLQLFWGRIGEGQLQVFAHADFLNFIPKGFQRALDGLALRVEDTFFKRHINLRDRQSVPSPPAYV